VRSSGAARNWLKRFIRRRATAGEPRQVYGRGNKGCSAYGLRTVGRDLRADRNKHSFPDRPAPSTGFLHSCMLSLAQRSSRWSRFLSTLPNNTYSDPRWLGWQVVIGIEVHAQLKSRKKLFSGEPRTAGYALDSFPTGAFEIPGRMTHPNLLPPAFPPLTRRSRGPCPFVFQTRFESSHRLHSDLQRLNPTCVALGVRAALALNSNVQHRSTFDRKHYFYQDLPTGYQITQHYGTASVRDPPYISANSLVAPISLGGYLTLGNGVRRVGIKQIQLEQVRSSLPPPSARPCRSSRLGHRQIHLRCSSREVVHRSE